MQLRLEQESVYSLIGALQNFLPHYIQHDMDLPPTIEFDIGFGEILWGALTRHVTWTEITYKNVILDIQGIKIEFI